MEYLSVKEVAALWGLSARSVRDYCDNGRIPGAILIGKTWHIPFNAEKPMRKTRCDKKSLPLLERLQEEQEAALHGGIYHRIQIDLTYNSNHIEGIRLSSEQTRYIFETNTIGVENEVVDIDDIIETVNHFRCVDMVIKEALKPLTETMIKQLHFMLKSGTSDSRRSWFAIGDYKRVPNEVGGRETVAPSEVEENLSRLLKEYVGIKTKTLDDLLDFHVRFERIHPFQDGNGRIGRLILFKECLRNGIVPFIITDELKFFYYRGLEQWDNTKGYLLDTCLTAQDNMKALLSYFHVPYD